MRVTVTEFLTDRYTCEIKQNSFCFSGGFFDNSHTNKEISHINLMMQHRPHTTVVMAMSADGKIADVRRSPARFGSLADKAHL